MPPKTAAVAPAVEAAEPAAVKPAGAAETSAERVGPPGGDDEEHGDADEYESSRGSTLGG